MSVCVRVCVKPAGEREREAKINDATLPNARQGKERKKKRQEELNGRHRERM